MVFADEVQQFVFTDARAKPAPQQLETADVFTEASESPHLVAQLPDTEFLGDAANLLI